MKIRLNGEEQEIRGAATLDALVAELGVERANLVIEHNGEVRVVDEWPAAKLGEGDVIEMVRFVGGG